MGFREKNAAESRRKNFPVAWDPWFSHSTDQLAARCIVGVSGKVCGIELKEAECAIRYPEELEARYLFMESQGLTEKRI